MSLQACYRPNEPSPTLQGLQQLQKALQELPGKWLAGGASKDDDYLHGTVTGECNYKFSLKVEGGGFFQTGMLVANAVRLQGGMPVPLTCKWKRRVGDHSVEIQGVSSNMYQISADDVGTHICVEARPADTDDGLWGAVVGEIGPFELDPATRRNLDNALGLGGSKFQVKQPPARGDNSGGQGQDLVVHVNATSVRVVPLQGGVERPSKEISVDYAPDYPRVMIHPLDTYKFDLVMSASKNLHLLAPSRAARDLIALTIRCLHTNKFVPTTDVLNALLPQAPMQRAGLPTIDSRLDACIHLERILKELNQAMMQKDVSEKVLRNTKVEKNQLQEQLMESISGCTEVMVGLQEQFKEGAAMSHAMPLDQQQQLVEEAKAQCDLDREELKKVRRRFDEMRQANKAAEESKPLMQRSREERDMLIAKQEKVTSIGSQQQQDTADQAHTMELKRLRQDVEMLHNKKEQLRRQLQDKESEKQELQGNFFYVKGQLDKWQLRVAQDADGEGAAKELERHHHTLTTAREERTRLSSRLEGLLRDMEKEKVYHEQQLERVVQANARLTEEKDRSQREVQRLSKMYSESVQQLQVECGGQAGSADPFATDASDMMGFADPEEVARVRALLLQMDSKLQQKLAENESLRNRIRKLAVE